MRESPASPSTTSHESQRRLLFSSFGFCICICQYFIWQIWKLHIWRKKPWESLRPPLPQHLMRASGRKLFENLWKLYFYFQALLRNCKSRWPVFLTGYLEKQLEPLTLRPNNWGPKAGLDIREREGETIKILKQETTPCAFILPLLSLSMTEDIILFTTKFDVWGFTWSWDVYRCTLDSHIWK